jgi:predicted dinucleotide-binding enzyme
VAAARRFAAAGQSVVTGSRNAARARMVADEVGATPRLPLGGKILVDATNPYLDDTFDGGEPAWTTREEFPPGESGAAAIQALAPGARVVKAWNHVWARTAERGLGETRPAVFLCGGDPEARAVVARLARETGYDPHDAGGLEQARWIEALTPLVIALGDSTVAMTMTRTPG